MKQTLPCRWVPTLPIEPLALTLQQIVDDRKAEWEMREGPKGAAPNIGTLFRDDRRLYSAWRHRCSQGSLSLKVVDEVCVRILGKLPFQIYPEWFELPTQMDEPIPGFEEMLIEAKEAA